MRSECFELVVVTSVKANIDSCTGFLVFLETDRTGEARSLLLSSLEKTELVEALDRFAGGISSVKSSSLSMISP